MAHEYVYNQTLDKLTSQNRLETIGSILLLIWLLGGLFNDAYLLLLSIVIVTLIFLYNSLLTLYSGSEYNYDIHSASFRRLIIAGLAHWLYSSGGARYIQFSEYTIPVFSISQIVLGSYLILWFSSRYLDQLRDGHTPERLIPFLIVRGVLRGAMISGLIFAIFWGKTPIPKNLQFPFLYLIYVIEPFFYAMYQGMNKTYSTLEMTMGNARLPSVALRESFLSNFFILLFTMMFNGVSGGEWQLLRVAYVLGFVIALVYSIESIKEFNKNPLGDDPLGNFFKSTPQILNNLDLSEEYGMVMDEPTSITLPNTSTIEIETGSILVPLYEKEEKMTALVLGKGKNIIETEGKRLAENFEGVSTIIIESKELDKLGNIVSTKLDKIDLERAGLPSMDKLEMMVHSLSNRLEEWVGGLLSKLNAIDLSGYSVTSDGPNQMVNLPGIQVIESPDGTQVQVAGLRVQDTPEFSTVRFGSVLTVVDIKDASFVSLPGITVLDVSGVGSAVSVFGLKVSDGIPADKLEEFKLRLLEKLDAYELGLNAEIGRILADKSVSGIFSLDEKGEFKPLIESKRKTLGNHIALNPTDKLQSRLRSKDQIYLPGNVEELANTESELEKLAPGRDKPNSDEKQTKGNSKSEVEAEIDSIKKSIKSTIKKSEEKDDESIYDVDYEEV